MPYVEGGAGSTSRKRRSSKTVDPAARRLTGRALDRQLLLAMIQAARRVAADGHRRRGGVRVHAAQTAPRRRRGAPGVASPATGAVSEPMDGRPLVEGSWSFPSAITKSIEEPTDYSPQEKHPELYRYPHAIKTGLRKCRSVHPLSSAVSAGQAAAETGRELSRPRRRRRPQ